MKRMDRYLLRQFAWVFFIFLSSFIGLYVVADSVNNYEELSRFSKDNGGLWMVLAGYYGCRSLAFFDQVSALLVLITAMFTIAAFRRHNEMTALMAAGIRKARIIRWVIVGAAVLCVTAVINREVIIPAFRDQLSFNAQDLVQGSMRDLKPRHDNATSIFFTGQGIELRNQTIVEPVLHLPRSLDQHGGQLAAESATYLRAEGDRPAGYRMKNVRQPEDLAEHPSLSIGDRPVILSPADTPWLAKDECFVVTGIDTEQLAGGTTWRQFASTAQLIKGMHNSSVDYGADVRVEIHSRVVRPFLDMTLLFLGLPLVLVRETRNLFLSVGNCVIVVILFMVVVMGCQYLGSNLLLTPAFAAWCPLMIFAPLAFGMGQPLLE